MTIFKKWISYLYAYSGEVKGNNIGFVRVEIRDGRCRLSIGIKGAYGCDTNGLDVGIYIRRQGRPQRISIGCIRMREGCGEFEEITEATDLFGKGITWEEWGGLWITSPDQNTIYLASWEKAGLDAREFLAIESSSPRDVYIQERQSLWDHLIKHYPRMIPQWQKKGVEMIRIRPADIRYLPRHLWYYSSNSFLLHGYYQYKHLILGRVKTEGVDGYLLGVPGRREPRESYSAAMFGFREFLPVQEPEGYWYTKIHL